MPYDFDREIDRRHSDCAKWDPAILKKLVGTDDVLPMWVADMEFASPPELIQALQERVGHGIFGYPSPAQAGRLSDAFRAWTDRVHHWEVPAEHIVLSPGMIPSISILIELLTDEHSGIIVQAPTYQPFVRIIEGQNRRVIANPLVLDREQNRFSLDLKDLEEQLAGDDVQMLIFCSPHNPAGRVWQRQELLQVLELCRTYGVKVISDEIHADLAYAEHTPLSSLSSEVITCMAPSKTFNMAGEHISFTIIPEQESRKKYQSFLSRFSLSTPGVLAMTAAQAAYEHGESWLLAAKEYLQGNLRILEEYLAAQLPEIRVISPEASFIAFLDCSAYLEASKGYCSLAAYIAQRAKVAMHDGLWFGEHGRGFVRINYALPRAELLKALEQLSEALKRPVI